MTASGTWPLPLAGPDIGELEQRYVAEVLASGRLSGGEWLERFEEHARVFCGVPYAVAVSSGTAALHLTVSALGIGPGDEVITTPYSFVASSNCLLFVGARPRFVDIEPESFNLDPSRVEDALGPAVKGILAVDVFGRPCDWPALTALARARGVALVADACESLGASIGDGRSGAWGDAACFGFYPNKQLTTGEGGLVTTSSPEIDAFCRSARNQGRESDDRMSHVRLGYNYRLDNLSCALGCAQFERLPTLLAQRAQRADWYRAALADLGGDVALPAGGPGSRSWFVYVVRLSDRFGNDARDRLADGLRRRGIASAPYFPCIHLQPYYRQRFGYRPGDFPIAEAASQRTLALPFFAGMRQEDVLRVAAAVKDLLPRLG